ncbi:MAG TPA: DUF4412 domain-containing protein [Myxococcaceae bacterium]|jgi:hypothetical protein|nr:DUF4412 domain-containing protein [Myxococcaceae bacterium]
MRLVVLASLLAASPALAADFEGVITGKSIGTEQADPMRTMTLSVAPAGFRVEGTVSPGKKEGGPGAPLHFVMLWRASEPGVTYFLNLDTKTYLKHELTKDNPGDPSAKAPTVEKLGKTTLLGRSVERVKIVHSSGSTEEMWIDTSLRFPPAAVSALSQGDPSRHNTWWALEKAGVTGIPLKQVFGEKNGWEATQVEKKSVSSSLFQIPAGFHQAKDALEMLSPEQQAEIQKKRQEMMQKMTPEQRQRMEEMMQKMQQQKAGQ